MASEASRRKVRKFVESYARKGPYGLYPEPEKVDSVVEGLAEHLDAHGKMYCPCTPIASSLAKGNEMVCPCTPHHDDIARQGYCDCALFASQQFIARERLKKGSR